MNICDEWILRTNKNYIIFRKINYFQALNLKIILSYYSFQGDLYPSTALQKEWARDRICA